MTEKSVAEKLFIKPQTKLLFVNPPQNILELLGNLPAQVEMINADSTILADLVMVFVANRSVLEACILPLKARLAKNGALWICYHKGTSKVLTDINRDTIWELTKPYGIAPVRQIAIDEDWSALRFKVVG
jgi:hypothetical protein